MSNATRLRMSLRYSASSFVAGGAPSVEVAAGVRFAVAPLDAVVGSLMTCLVLVKNDPRHKSVNDRQARVDERGWRCVRFEMIRSNNPSADQRQSQPADDTDHPCRK